MLASIGARKRWSLFGGNGATDAGDLELEPDAEEPFVAHSMLGDLASHAPSRIEEPEPEPEPERRSLLALGGAAASIPIPAPQPPAEEPPAPIVFGQAGLHSTVGELAGLEEHPGRPFPIERFILISLLAHLILVVVLMVVPTKIPVSSKGDLFAALAPQPKDDTPIPVIFADAPGAPRPNPKRSPLSDADRRAGGGDASKPKADTPFAPPSGVAGLAPGPRAPRAPGGAAAARAGKAGGAQQQQQADAAPKRADQKPSDFPNMNPPVSSGPKEMTRLAGLDSAIREAARGAVGGEGGSPRGDPEGGFVDSGPISFDTTWYDWGPYAAEMVRRIKLHWDVPELARLGWKGSLTVRFFILGDGTVADAKILRGSGIPPFDFAAFQAILKSSKFRPLPADLHSDREGVTVTFFYNMRPEMEEAGAK